MTLLRRLRLWLRGYRVRPRGPETFRAETAGWVVPMTKGALQAEAAQGEFRTAPGRSREEAVRFAKDMNNLPGPDFSAEYEQIVAAIGHAVRGRDLIISALSSHKLHVALASDDPAKRAVAERARNQLVDMLKPSDPGKG